MAIATGIGLATEAAGGLLPALDRHKKWVWAALGVLAVLAVIDLATNGSARARRRRRLGRPVANFSPADLGVRDPIGVPDQRLPEQTVYVRRAHDERLGAAVGEVIGGTSRLVTLVGDSSTGKTRACHEAVQVLSRRWWLWHPIDPSHPEAVLGSLADVRPCTVVWINDGHHYLATADPAVGERVAAGLRTLLADSRRAPVLVLATLWPQFWRQLTATPGDGQPDPHAQARALLTGTEVTVPVAFIGEDLAAVRAAATQDRRLAIAMDHAEAGRITQYLAGVPEQLRRYHTASAGSQAVLDAAIDARRLGHPVHLGAELLRRAAPGYLSQADQTALHRQFDEAWFDLVVDDLDQPQHGIAGPLTRISTSAGPALRLADAIEQAGAIARAGVFPPASFWNAVAATITDPALLTAFAGRAEHRSRYRRAIQMYALAANLGDTAAMVHLARRWADAGDYDAAERLLRTAAELGDTAAMTELARWRDEAGNRDAADELLRAAAHRGDTDAALILVRRQEAIDYADDEEGRRQAAAARGDFSVRVEPWQPRPEGFDDAAFRLGFRVMTDRMRQDRWRGNYAAEEELLREAADRGATDALLNLAMLRYRAGDRTTAEQLLREAADRGDTDALVILAEWREKVGDYTTAEQFAQSAANRGDTAALLAMARLREKAGDHTTAQQLLRQAANRGATDALLAMARLREKAGDHTTAQQLLLFGLTDDGEPADSLG